MPWNLCYLAGLISLMAGSEECFRDFIFISVNTNKCFQRSMQRPDLSFSQWIPMTFLQKSSAHQLNLAHSGHWTWWWFNGKEQEKCVIKGLKITLGKIKFISFLAAQCLALHPWALHACLHHHQWFVWPLLLWVLMILSNIDSCSVLHLSPTWYFLEILGISIQMAFPEFGQISSFSRGRTPFLELKHYF